MDSSNQEGKGQKKITEVKTFPVLFPLKDNQGNLTINTTTPSKLSKEEIIKQAFKFHSKGNILEAIKYYQDFIDQGFEDYIVFSNYGTILKGLGKLNEAEIMTRKAIELNPNMAEANYNLGNLLKDLGNFKGAELYTRKAIEINPKLAMAHYNLGTLLRNQGNINQAIKCSENFMSLRPWSIIGSYSFNHKLKLD